MDKKKTPAKAATLTVRDATMDLLRRLEMTTVFGNPGSTELPFLNNWPDDFRYILALQESSAVAMADVYARATGRAAFCNLHSAVGIGHALGRPARLFPFPPALLPVERLTGSLEVDDSAIRNELGWRPPFSMEQGLHATAEWYRTR